MAVEIIFEEPTGELVPLVLDASPEQNHRASAAASENEVERGIATTDHVRPERRMLTLDVVISDTPIAPTAALGGSVQSRDILVGGRATKTLMYQPDRTPTRVADSWKLLMDARDRSLLAIVGTNLEVYRSMALVEITTTRTAADGSWLRCQLVFAEVRQVESEYVEAAPVPARPRDRRPENDGSVETEPAPPRLRSAASRIRDGGLASLFGGG